MRASLLLAVIVFAPALASAQEPCTGDAQRVVDAVYRQILERSSNGEGAGLVTQLNNGQASVREVVRDIARSPEHRQRFLTGNGESAVTYLYRHLLGRAPDPNGLRTYVQALSRQDVSTVIDNMINSGEYREKFGDNAVPGAAVRYCRGAASGANSSNSSASRMRFGNLDRNGNGAIEFEEWNGNRNSFNVQDWNGDGVLSGEEVRPGARRAARAAAENFDPADRATWTEQAFLQFDRNRDNRITSTEWFHSAEYFRRADRNRDGALVLSEFTGSASPTTSPTTPNDERDDQFLSLDVNRNNRVERREWQGSADAFQWLDRNNDNVLSRAEVLGEGEGQMDSFASLDLNRNSTLSADEWRWSRRSFDRADADGDGILTRREFAASGGAPETAPVR
jgi:Ca2+-binding EF-hand superfamily protein